MRVGCAAVRAALGEPLHGTAPTAAVGWLLLEHPGPWPYSGPPDDFPPAVADLWHRAKEAGVRPQLIRRTARRRPVPPRRVFIAASRAEHSWVETAELNDLHDLADLDLGAVAAGRRPGFGTAHPDRLLLVCTHGRHDACCAQWGRGVARSLADAHGDAVWETTHVGGDRFAANVVCLPEGTYHGGTDPDTALTVGAAAMRGEVALPHFRGRAGLAAAVQSAEWFARRALECTAVDQVGPLRYEAHGDLTTVELAVGGTRVRVILRRALAETSRLTSCAEETCSAPEYYELVSIDALAAA